jgi:YD repeat-containing protein
MLVVACGSVWGAIGASEPPTTDPCACRNGARPGVHTSDPNGCGISVAFPPPGGVSDGLLSACWGPAGQVDLTGAIVAPCHPPFSTAGFSPSLDPQVGAMQGDYPPISHDPAWSTSPLAATGRLGEMPLSLAERPTVGSALDMITGQPLVREVDFELPFGSTVFRHIRTYSQVPGYERESHSVIGGTDKTFVQESGLWWDWAGHGWALSHNPVLLIDAAYDMWDRGIVDVSEGQQATHIERCMFLPDAHRTIPFISDGEGRYIAPARFDAQIAHDGEICTHAGGLCDPFDVHHWVVRPTTWTVWTENRGLKYTMAPVYEDMQEDSMGTSLNQYPPLTTNDLKHRFYGRPYYAVATRIEDRHDNEIRLSYCDFVQSSCGGEPDASGCADCCQGCTGKGRISQVQLRAGMADGASERTLQYTLVYVYRENNGPSAEDPTTAHRLQPMVHEVYVVPGHIEVPDRCRTIGLASFKAITDRYVVGQPQEGQTTDPLEVLEELHGMTWVDHQETGDAAWLDGWTMRVRYLYADGSPFFQSHVFKELSAEVGPMNGEALRPIQVTVTHREQTDPARDPVLDGPSPTIERDEHRVYRHRWTWSAIADSERSVLRAIFSDASLSAMRSGGTCAVNAALGGTTTLDRVRATWPLGVHFLESAWPVEIDGCGGEGETRELLEWAETQFDYWGDMRSGRMISGSGWPSAGEIGNEPKAAPFFQSAFHDELVTDYLRGVPKNPSGDGQERPEVPVMQLDGPAMYADRQGGQERNYRIYRFLMTPTNVEHDLRPKCLDTLSEHYSCEGLLHACYGVQNHVLRSILHEPYMWAGLEHLNIPRKLKDTDRGNPLWVSVVDEFASYDDLITQAVHPGDGVDEWASIESRLAATGDAVPVPLTRTVTLINSAGYVLSSRVYDFSSGTVDSSGMWEEFVYDWQSDEFAPKKSPTETRPLAIGRLLEHRGFGWSIAKQGDGTGDLDDGDVQGGLVSVYGYDLGSTSEKVRDALLPSAIGLKWGTAASAQTYWLKQTVRDPLRPELIVHEIEFTSPRDTLLAYEVLDPGEVVAASQDGAMRVTTHARLFDRTVRSSWIEEDELAIEDSPLVAELTLRPPAKSSPDGVLEWPISITYRNAMWNGDAIGAYQRSGQMEVWTGAGAVGSAGVSSGLVYNVTSEGSSRFTFDPAALDGELLEFYASVERIDPQGKLILKVVDVDLEHIEDSDTGGQPSGGLGTRMSAVITAAQVGSVTGDLMATLHDPFRAPVMESAWVRKASRPDINKPLEHWAFSSHDSTEPYFTIDHTGRQTRVFKRSTLDTLTNVLTRTRMVSKGLFRVPDGVWHVIRAFELGEVTYEIEGEDTVMHGVSWEYDGEESNPGHDPRVADIVSIVEMAMDALSRPNELRVIDPKTAETLRHATRYGRFGEVTRERHHNGNIVRNVHDERGRLVAVYKGSNDAHEFWGTHADGDPQANDDLLLTERRFYGVGVRDANLPIEVRTYRTKPANQYGEDPSGPSVDTQGAATRSIYDWRGRVLVSRSYAPDTTTTPTGYGPVVRQEVVFRDNQDQVLITAVFGSSLPWQDDDIPTLDPGQVIPSITGLLAAGPVSLEERFYDPRGQLRATRQYDVSDATGQSYLETETYQDFAGRTVYSRSHGNIVTRNVQDAKGRQILSSTFLGEMELTRTETSFDDKDQPFRVKSYDRSHAWVDPGVSGYSAILSHTNAIITYRYTWYDAAGRVRATADIGTGRADGYITSTSFDDTVSGDPDGFAWDPNDEVAWIPYPAFENFEIRETPLAPRAPGTSSGSWLDGIDARYTSYAYDDAGNTTVTVAPDGVVTRTRTNGLGQLVFQWENAPRTIDPEGGLVPAAGSRLTVNRYVGANLVAVGVLLDTASVDVSWFLPTSEIDFLELPWDEPGKMLVSRVGYTAPVLHIEPDRTDGTEIVSATPHSTNGEFVRGILYPTSAGEILSILPAFDVTYTYYADGLLATRTDERGVLFKYYYDHAGRLAEVLADESNSTTYLYNAPAPKDRVDRVLFTYNQTTGQLETAQAFDRDGGPGASEVLIATNEYDYDARLNLIAESQLHAGAIVPGTIPATTYQWQYSSADPAAGAGAGRNFDRIKRLGYPVPVPDPSSSGATTDRSLELFYGSPGSTFDAQSLVSRVEGTFEQYLARFRYTGSGRRVAFNRGGVTEQTALLYSRFFDNPIADFGGGEGSSGVGTIYDANDLSGLTQFGQPRTVSFWREPTGQPRMLQAGHRYAYDPAGRRTAAWSWQRPVAGPNPLPGDPLYGTNQRSQMFGYDPLGRLIDARMGELGGEIAGDTSPTMSVSASDLLTQPRVVEWELDLRETWLSRSLSEDANFDGTPEISARAHYVGERNELVGWEVPPSTGPPTGPPTDPTDRFHNDASGNLILDDARFYEYDAWGRLARVSDRGTIAVDLLEPGTNDYTLSGTPGSWLAHYTYDALGRLIRKQTPVRNASTGTQTGIRTERYYYDGARRIQEVVAAPIELIEPFTGGGSGGGEPDPLDGGTNIGEEMLAQGGEPTQPGGGGSPGGGGGVGGIEIQDVWLDREYVYVPSNAGGYVDEFIAQIDRFNDVWFILQDANFNVLGLTDSGGELVEQRTYDPYGELLTRESFTAHPGFKAGHQGLFFDRLEPSPAVGGSVSMGAASQLEPSTFGIYQVRNRVLIPRYGRWAQKDPNASGMLHASLWHDGQSPSPDLAAGSLEAMLGDGANLFAFVGNNPFNATDPSGLFITSIMIGIETRAMYASPYKTLLAASSAAMFANDVYQTVSGQQSWLELFIDGMFTVTGFKLLDVALDAYQGTKLAKRAPALTGFALAKKNGDVGESWLKKHIGGTSQKYFNTTLGRRFVDQVGPNGIAHESKVGWTDLTQQVRVQIQKDAELVASGQVSDYVWHFFPSPTNGLSGASKPLLDFLRHNNIRYTIH